MMYSTAAALARKNFHFRSLVYNHLVHTCTDKRASFYWDKMWKHVVLPLVTYPVKTKLHGYNAKVNCGFSYPLVSRIHKQFNNPLLQVCYQVHKQKQRPINLIDVGAAIGDTVFLLHANLQNAFSKILCVDGDKEFFEYLTLNMQQFPFVECRNALLSDVAQAEKSLVRIHAGTASAQGSEEVVSIPLDELVGELDHPNIDVLKSDTDGFDGRVLAGARNILKQSKPVVIYEWHPLLIQQTNNELSKSFLELSNAGYSHFAFFTKTGSFSHFMQGYQQQEIDALAEDCFENEKKDWHYDVVAVPEASINLEELAEASFAKNKKSAY